MRRPPLDWITRNTNIMSRNKAGLVTKVHVKGGEDREYDVIIRRNDNKLSVECREDLGRLGDRPCQALIHGRVCYHARAALTMAAYDQRKWLRFYRTKGLGRLGNLFKHVLPLYLFGKNEPSEWVMVYKIKEKDSQ